MTGVAIFAESAPTLDGAPVLDMTRNAATAAATAATPPPAYNPTFDLPGGAIASGAGATGVGRAAGLASSRVFGGADSTAVAPSIAPIICVAAGAEAFGIRSTAMNSSSPNVDAR